MKFEISLYEAGSPVLLMSKRLATYAAAEQWAKSWLQKYEGEVVPYVEIWEDRPTVVKRVERAEIEPAPPDQATKK